jgi:hypothetical protein
MNKKEMAEKAKIKIDDIEEVKAEFFDEGAILVSPFYLYRINNKGRFYAKVETIEEEKEITTKISLAAGHTTVIQNCSPTPHELMEWKIRLGDKAKVFSGGAADYGSFGHYMISELIKGEKLIFDSLWIESKMEKYMNKTGKDFDRCMEYVKQEKRNMLKDLYCFIKWYQDFKVKPIVCEYPIFVEFEEPEQRGSFYVGKYSAILDFVCELTLPAIKSGKNKREEETIKAIVDWKFRHSHAFYEGEKVQLHAQHEAWKWLHPDIEIDRQYNWSPNDFRLSSKDPKYYDFKDQTVKENSQVSIPDLWESYLMQFHTRKDYFNGMQEKHDFKFVSIGLEDELDDIIESIDVFEEISQTGDF